MNDKKIFSFNLYKSVFLQIKVIGIIGIVLSVFISCTRIINEASSYKAYLKHTDTYGKIIVSGVSDNEYLVVIIPFIILTLGILIWHFQNTRSGSDFYHSLPYTRNALFLSRFLAATSWFFLIILSSLVSQLICYGFNSQWYVIDNKGIILMHISMFLYGFQALCAISLGCALTGNVLSNCITSGMIIFLPRFITSLAFELIDSATILRVNNVPGLLNNRYNLDVGIIFSDLGFNQDFDFTEIVTCKASYIYTIILSIIYLLLAMIVFNKRKSEYAGQGAISKPVRFVICVAIVTAINIVSFVTFINSEGGYQDVWEIVATILVTIFVLGLYEFVSSKRIAYIYKAIPGFIVGFVLTILISFGLDFIIDNINNYTPTLDNTKSVTLSVMCNNANAIETNYLISQTKSIEIKDEEVIDILSNAFEKSKEQAKKDNFDFASEERNIAVIVGFKGFVFDNKRIVWLNEDEINNLAARLESNAKYKKVYYDYPDIKKVSVNYDGPFELDYNKANEVYSIAVQELKSLDFKDCFYARLTNSYNDFNVDFSRNGKKYNVSIPLSQDYTPEAMSEMMNYRIDELNSNTELKDELIKKLEGISSDSSVDLFDYGAEFSLTNGKKYSIRFALHSYSCKDRASITAHEYSLSEQDKKEIIETAIKALKTGQSIEKINANDKFLCVYVSRIYDDDYYENYDAYYQDEDINEVSDYIYFINMKDKY